MPQCHHISLDDARKLALVSQHLPRSSFRRGLVGTREAIQHLGYVQIDTISVVQRAHHHTLWNRVPHYRPRYLEQLISDRSIFEYWSHAAAYLPMEDYRFCLPRMRAIANGQRLWYPRNQKLMRQVLARIEADGPLRARDFEPQHRQSGGLWEWGPVKQAIENLFQEGRILVTRRENFQKLFDLTERVLPRAIDTTVPTKNDYAHHLIHRHLNANGLGRSTEFGYQRRGMGAAVNKALAEKLEAREIFPIKIGKIERTYYVTSRFEQILSKRSVRKRVRILSPFDNLVIQRRRIEQLFDFDYQLECYLPAAKRRHGYFCLPILWQGRLVARMDAKANRKTQDLIVHRLQMEDGVKDLEDFSRQLCTELRNFMQFNGCQRIVLRSVSPHRLRSLMLSPGAGL